MREGRKWGVQVSLCSQSLESFDAPVVDMATCALVLGLNGDADAARAQKAFALSPAATAAAPAALRGPGRDGAGMLVLLHMPEGRHEHFVTCLPGATELWAFSATAEDAFVRDRLYTLVGPAEARRHLAAAFPGGSAKAEIERRRAIGGRGEDGLEGVAAQVVSELVAPGQGPAYA